MATEQQYDELIAPKLAEVGMLCANLGMSIVARVEWAPDQSGITQIVPDTAGVGQKLTQLAAHSRGNIDSLLIAAMRKFDYSQSVFLYPYRKSA